MYSYTFYRISQYVILHNLVMLSIFHYFFFILLAFLLFFPVSVVAFSISILYNKFPYYFEPNVKHICIWSKLKIPVDKNSEVGDISVMTKKLINRYLEKTFVAKGISWDQIVWFKNWLSLQSVRSISHIHVILKDVDDKFVDELISGGSGEVLTLDDYRNLE